MPNDQLFLDPDRAMRGAKNLSATGKNFKGLRDTEGGVVAAASAKHPWGKDDIGAAFEKVYRPAEQSTLDAWAGLAAYLEGLGDAAAQAVTNNVQSDDSASSRISSSWKST